MGRKAGSKNKKKSDATDPGATVLDFGKLKTSDNQTIGKVTITKDNTLNVSYTETLADNTVNEYSRKGGGLIHPDLQKQMNRLKPHLAILCDQKDAPKQDDLEDVDLEKLKKYDIAGFVMNSTGESEGVSIHGTKVHGTKSLALQTPCYKWDDDYQHIDALSEVIEACLHEAKMYLAGKYLVKQLELEMEGADFSAEEQAAINSAAFEGTAPSPAAAQ